MHSILLFYDLKKKIVKIFQMIHPNDKAKLQNYRKLKIERYCRSTKQYHILSLLEKYIV